ncbi:MAG TPA: sigma-54 dependent transcriptional regulator [Blastocatellia bacterium]|nr:sigma-54 dependent transcriptional regulator [Blastocatellia bacterium]
MNELLTPESPYSLLDEARLQPGSSRPSRTGVDALLDAQWNIILHTLKRVLGTTELYETLVQELARALHQNDHPSGSFGTQANTHQNDFSLPGLVYSSSVMHELARQIHKTRNSKLPVLITGEPGTGKEGIAHALHWLSDRSAGPFVAFNCTIVTKELISSQLFGHRKGSFTGADANYQGSIRSAEGGTIFLDEIGDLPLDLQPKLLRFLQAGEIHPVGESKPVKVDVRVITATNRDLEAMVAQGLFREDLYYRINILRYHLPPLRNRREDIPAVAFHLLERFAAEAQKEALTFSPEALARLTQADWPGNIRQLANQIQRAIALVGEEQVIQPHHLWVDLTNERRKNSKRDWLDEILQELPATAPTRAEAEVPQRTRPRKLAPTKRTLAQEVDGLEREIIVETLEKANFNLMKTAQELGLSRRGLALKMSRLQIDPKALKTTTTQDAKPV